MKFGIIALAFVGSALAAPAAEEAKHTPSPDVPTLKGYHYDFPISSSIPPWNEHSSTATPTPSTHKASSTASPWAKHHGTYKSEKSN
ncbi:putative secreted peptide [Aspergillus thermomutatus]|uniref:Uncharacterized protein n=1 Tax=Aspergillus thermomutatus TaxID=41047 RepID=A0A397H3T8_ASPTH|nr:uncharacterized protein CDV56_108225 [Aspergillus thermomutatus]RHZ56296.1 hypothetical protein CDV56_108225 [Aspergillus thermomutatus]